MLKDSEGQNLEVEKEFIEISPHFEVAFSLGAFAHLKLVSQKLHCIFHSFSG